MPVLRFGSLQSLSCHTCNSVAQKPRWSFSTSVQMCMFTLNTALSSTEAPQSAANQSEMPGAGRTECCGWENGQFNSDITAQMDFVCTCACILAHLNRIRLQYDHAGAWQWIRIVVDCRRGQSCCGARTDHWTIPGWGGTAYRTVVYNRIVFHCWHILYVVNSSFFEENY